MWPEEQELQPLQLKCVSPERGICCLQRSCEQRGIPEDGQGLQQAEWRSGSVLSFLQQEQGALRLLGSWLSHPGREPEISWDILFPPPSSSVIFGVKATRCPVSVGPEHQVRWSLCRGQGLGLVLGRGLFHASVCPGRAHRQGHPRSAVGPRSTERQQTSGPVVRHLNQSAFLAGKKQWLSWKLDCLVQGVLGLDKQVTLATWFEPDCTGTELSLLCTRCMSLC